MAIDSTANKFKESSKDSWMTSQTKPVSQSSTISPKGSKMDVKLVFSFGQDSVMKNAYTGHLSGGNVITDKAAHMESHTIAKAVA